MRTIKLGAGKLAPELLDDCVVVHLYDWQGSKVKTDAMGRVKLYTRGLAGRRVELFAKLRGAGGIQRGDAEMLDFILGIGFQVGGKVLRSREDVLRAMTNFKRQKRRALLKKLGVID